MLPAIYLVIALCVTTLLCFVFAPFGAPDEENQSLRAMQVSHGGWLPKAGTAEAGGWADANAAKVLDRFDTLRMAWEKRGADYHDRPWGTLTEPQQAPWTGIRWSRQTVFAGFGNTAVYPPFLYLPAATGWRLGEFADLSIVGSLRLARLLSAWAAVVLGWLAMRLVPRSARWTLFAVLLLPSTLFLNASCSQDAVLLSVAALAAALVARPLAARRDFTRGELVPTAFLLAFAALSRPPYLMLGLLLFLPAIRSQERARGRFGRAALGFAVVVAAVLLWRHAVAPFGLDTADEADVAGQLTFLRAHPLAAGVAVARGTMVAAADFWRRGLYVLGWNDLLAPWPLRLVTGGALFLMIGASVRRLRGRSSVGLLLVACGGALLGVSLAEYLIWTPPGFGTVYGILPRYWLPVFPFAALLATEYRRPAFAPAAFGTLVSLLVAASLPLVAARMFYLEGLFQVLRLNLQ